VLKERYAPGMSLTEAMRLAIAALASQGDGSTEPITGSQLEAALLERSRPHRAFRRLTSARLDALLAETGTGEAGSAETGGGSPNAASNGAAGDAHDMGPGEPGNGTGG
jgi:proteasome alpha subunit